VIQCPLVALSLTPRYICLTPRASFVPIGVIGELYWQGGLARGYLHVRADCEASFPITGVGKQVSDSIALGTLARSSA